MWKFVLRGCEWSRNIIWEDLFINLSWDKNPDRQDIREVEKPMDAWIRSISLTVDYAWTSNILNRKSCELLSNSIIGRIRTRAFQWFEPGRSKDSNSGVPRIRTRAFQGFEPGRSKDWNPGVPRIGTRAFHGFESGLSKDSNPGIPRIRTRAFQGFEPGRSKDSNPGVPRFRIRVSEWLSLTAFLEQRTARSI